jgi:hypothetical protein
MFRSASASKRPARRLFSRTIAAPSPRPWRREQRCRARRPPRRAAALRRSRKSSLLADDDREVPLAIDCRSRPATSQPVGVDDRHAEEGHALLVPKGSDLLRVFVLRGPHPETGKQLHRASVPESSSGRAGRFGRKRAKSHWGIRCGSSGNVRKGEHECPTPPLTFPTLA